VPRSQAVAASLLVALALAASGCGSDPAGGSWTAAAWDAVAGALGLAPGDDGTAPAQDPGAGKPGGVLAAVDRALGGGEEAPVADEGPGYWRYTEPGGSVRFVQSLAEVPAALREDAERIATAPRRPAAAARPAVRRPALRPAAALARGPEPANAGAAKVVVYTTSWCPWCRKTIAWLDARGVDYENRDIEQREEWAAELREKSGAGSVPVVDVGGRLVRGFDQRALEELL
jgi:glutaredoxin